MPGSRKILLLITDLQIGGTPTVVRELARRLHDPPNVEIHVASLAPRGPVAEEIESFGVSTSAFDARKPSNIGAIFRLRKFLRAERFDTIFSFLVHANVAAAFASLNLPNLRRVQSIQTTQPNPRWHWAAQRFAAPSADWIVVPSKSVADVAIERSRIAPQKIIVIPNAIDASAFADLPRPAPNNGSRQIAIVCIGRLDPIKNIPDVVAALTHLDPRYQLHIYGEGADRSRIESAIAARGLWNRVTLHGAISHPRKALEIADIVMLASSAEGFGLVLIEAMAAGVPVVAAQAPGICDVVEHNRNGLLVPIGDSAAIAAAIERIIGTPVLAERFIENGRAVVAQRFSWPPALTAYRKILDLPPNHGEFAGSPKVRIVV